MGNELGEAYRVMQERADAGMTPADLWEKERLAHWKQMREAWERWNQLVAEHEAQGYNGKNPFNRYGHQRETCPDLNSSLIFTLKARWIISRAVNAYGNDHQRDVWRSWAAVHQDVRRGPADAYEGGKGYLAPDVVQVALSTLNQMFNAMQASLASQSLSDDETADLSDDMGLIRLLVKTLGRQARPANVPPSGDQPNSPGVHL